MGNRIGTWWCLILSVGAIPCPCLIVLENPEDRSLGRRISEIHFFRELSLSWRLLLFFLTETQLKGVLLRRNSTDENYLHIA